MMREWDGVVKEFVAGREASLEGSFLRKEREIQR
jgi:hypothetical protein